MATTGTRLYLCSSVLAAAVDISFSPIECLVHGGENTEASVTNFDTDQENDLRSSGTVLLLYAGLPATPCAGKVS